MENQYKKLLEDALSFFDGWHDDTQKKQFMKSLYMDAPLYASDRVIKLANQFLRSFDDKNLEHRGKSDTIYRQMVLEIRKEMKGSIKEKTDLSEEDIDILKINS